MVEEAVDLMFDTGDIGIQDITFQRYSFGITTRRITDTACGAAYQGNSLMAANVEVEETHKGEKVA